MIYLLLAVILIAAVVAIGRSHTRKRWKAILDDYVEREMKT
jgi:hypothetical protein